MSSPIDKKYGDMYIFGEYPNGNVDVVLSAHGFELTIENQSKKVAEELMLRWDALKGEAERLAEYEWMYNGLQE